ncbi:MAG: hypothetical protein AAFY38_07355 [Pseudomonadota bacterium]
MTNRFHILRDGEAVTLARHLPPRFDVQASTRLRGGRAERLAHQVRQDMWRALRHVRGFSPVVRLEADEQGWHLTAGGRVAGRVPAGLPGRIADLLEDESHRVRWLRCAGGAS